MYRQFNIQQLYALPTLCLCVLYRSENKQRLFPYAALTDWYIITVAQCLKRGTDWVFKSNICISAIKLLVIGWRDRRKEAYEIGLLVRSFPN